MQVRYGKENNSRSLPYKVRSLPCPLVTELTEEWFWLFSDQCISVIWCILMSFSVWSRCLSGTPCTRVGRQAVARQSARSIQMSRVRILTNMFAIQTTQFEYVYFKCWLVEVKLQMQCSCDSCNVLPARLCGRIPSRRSKRSRRERHSQAWHRQLRSGQNLERPWNQRSNVRLYGS